jgi:hypothetical protein
MPSFCKDSQRQLVVDNTLAVDSVEPRAFQKRNSGEQCGAGPGELHDEFHRVRISQAVPVATDRYSDPANLFFSLIVKPRAGGDHEAVGGSHIKGAFRLSRWRTILPLCLARQWSRPDPKGRGAAAYRGDAEHRRRPQGQIMLTTLRVHASGEWVSSLWPVCPAPKAPPM